MRDARATDPRGHWLFGTTWQSSKEGLKPLRYIWARADGRDPMRAIEEAHANAAAAPKPVRHIDSAGAKTCWDSARRLARGLWPRPSAARFRYFPSSPRRSRL